MQFTIDKKKPNFIKLKFGFFLLNYNYSNFYIE